MIKELVRTKSQMMFLGAIVVLYTMLASIGQAGTDNGFFKQSAEVSTGVFAGYVEVTREQNGIVVDGLLGDQDVYADKSWSEVSSKMRCSKLRFSGFAKKGGC